jgi:hypothetical protein
MVKLVLDSDLHVNLHVLHRKKKELVFEGKENIERSKMKTAYDLTKRTWFRNKRS